jgi:RimJ/RimL family protein N-acetyltransferase
MRNQERSEFVVFHPKQKAPHDLTNLFLERCIQEILSHSSLPDLTMRFFGSPDVAAIAGRITGRIPDSYEQPRDTVIVAFVNRRPVGYLDLARFSGQPDTAEISILIQSDQQRKGIGQALLQDAVQEARDEGIRRLESYVHLENNKMKKALQKWSQTEAMHDVTIRKSLQEGEIVFRLDIASKR